MAYVSMEAGVCVQLLPSLRIINRMIMIRSIVGCARKGLVTTSNLASTLNIPHSNNGVQTPIQALLLTPILCKNTVKSLPEPIGITPVNAEPFLD